MSKTAIPDEALDDRLGFVGTSGSGKTYGAKGRVERLLKLGHRAVIVDALDVWWGLRLSPDGKKAGFDVAVLGGKHGDMPINEHSGALIGEAVATSSESCIVSLGGMKTQAARQRFMLAFLDAVYEHTDPDRGDPYHFVVDEADLWAPQKPMGNEAMLCHLMEEIVRRGRVKGFIPWVITQRPAVINKNVLSMVDGLIALKLTSSQDRDALWAWVEGQGDRQEGKAMIAQLPALQRGEGIIWIPSRHILKTAQFPENSTFDSSRTPKRGEKKIDAKLQPLNIEALKSRLVTVEQEAKANDPKSLKIRIAELERELAKASIPKGGLKEIDHGMIFAAAQEARAIGREEGFLVGHHVGAGLAGVVGKWMRESIKGIGDQLNGRLDEGIALAQAQEFTEEQAGFAGVGGEAVLKKLRKGLIVEKGSERAKLLSAAPAAPAPRAATDRMPLPVRAAPPPAAIDPELGRAKQAILDALAWWESIGRHAIDRVVLAFLIGVSNKSSGHQNNLGALRTAGLIEYPPGGGMAELTPAGRAKANPPEAVLDSAALQQRILGKLNPPMRAIVELLLDGRERSKDELAEELGVSAKSSGHQNNLGSLRTMGFITYPKAGSVVIGSSMFI